jgi:hypothetical protein
MIKSIYLLICFLFIVNCGFSQDSTTLSKPTFDVKMRYDSVKVEFDNYEKKHGGFVNTKNIRMHYLEWAIQRTHL